MQVASFWELGECESEAVKPNVVFFHEKAPLYEKMDRIVNSMANSDLIVVIRTSGQVVEYGRMTGARRSGINVMDDPFGWIASSGHLLFDNIDMMSADVYMKERYNHFVDFLNRED